MALTNFNSVTLLLFLCALLAAGAALLSTGIRRLLLIGLREIPNVLSYLFIGLTLTALSTFLAVDSYGRLAWIGGGALFLLAVFVTLLIWPRIRANIPWDLVGPVIQGGALMLAGFGVGYFLIKDDGADFSDIVAGVVLSGMGLWMLVKGMRKLYREK